jgi:hypothetical protein
LPRLIKTVLRFYRLPRTPLVKSTPRSFRPTPDARRPTIFTDEPTLNSQNRLFVI